MSIESIEVNDDHIYTIWVAGKATHETFPLFFSGDPQNFRVDHSKAEQTTIG